MLNKPIKTMKKISEGFDRVRNKRAAKYLVTVYEFIELKNSLKGRSRSGEYRIIEHGRIAVWNRKAYTEYILG